MKAFLLAFSMMFAVGCTSSSDTSGGVIVVDDTPAIPVIPGPFGGPISNDNPINGPTPFIQPYTSQEFQALVDATASGGTLEVDRDAHLKNIVFIDKPIKIKNKPGKRITLKMLESGQFSIAIAAAGTTFSDLVISLENNSQPFQGERDQLGFPLSQNLTIERNEFYLRNTVYSLQFSFNNLKIRNNSFIGLCDFCMDLYVLNIFSSNGGELIGNLIVDTNDQYDTALFLQDASNFLVRSNVVKSFSKETFGALTCLGCINVSLESNILHDSNNGRLNAPNGVPNQYLDGSIAIAVAASDNVRDNGASNKYKSDRFVLSDDLVGGSTNVNLGTGTLRAEGYLNGDLFNYFPTLDLHPICLGSNPTISSTPVAGWSNYMTSGGLLYYAGSIVPACF